MVILATKVSMHDKVFSMVKEKIVELTKLTFQSLQTQETEQTVPVGTTSTSPSLSAAASTTNENDKYANVKGFKARHDPWKSKKRPKGGLEIVLERARKQRIDEQAANKRYKSNNE
ncbi:unnamed protein product [Linum tenue]|uniref:Uncharacterized protein n=1 Tax=Linum tenue TaxID=586396 RepID=A0AAV0LFQ9_9ROSI|nr:unnamed protein product [Linum tenue]